MNARGFSMAELLVVVAITGMVAALGYPYFVSYMRASSLKGAAEEVAAIVNGARQLAIARNVPVCVRLSGSQALYMINTSAACGGGTTFVGTTTRADGTMPLSNGMDISAATANVVFTNLGAASPAGTYTVRNPADGRTLSVVVAASGRVRIQ